MREKHQLYTGSDILHKENYAVDVGTALDNLEMAVTKNQEIVTKITHENGQLQTSNETLSG